MLLEGLHIPLTMPFHPDARLNLHKLAANVERYSRTPAAGLIVLGPSGEPTLLNDDETREVLRTAAEAAALEKVLIAGISRDSVHSTLDLATYAASQGYDAALIPLSAAAAGAHETVAYFQAVADRSPLPLVLLSAGAHSISAELASELATHPNILGLLTGSANIPDILVRTAAVKHDVTVTPVFAAVTSRMKQAMAGGSGSLVPASSLAGTATAIAEAPALPALRTRTRTVGFQILGSTTSSLLKTLKAGAVGIAPAFAACAPQACYEVFAAWKDGDQPLAEEKQARLVEAAAQAESLGPGGLKFACDLNGYYGGVPRLPHLPPTGEHRAILEASMTDLRN